MSISTLSSVAQQLAGLPMDKMQAGAGRAGERLKLDLRRFLNIILQPVLHVQVGRRALENDRTHAALLIPHEL
ncbi:MAG: hypothetical protein HY852_19395 [Bradyrhizobium sp.]|nr:hypothetical protein [Bradyrhizobium sp.]